MHICFWKQYGTDKNELNSQLKSDVTKILLINIIKVDCIYGNYDACQLNDWKFKILDRGRRWGGFRGHGFVECRFLVAKLD